MPSRPVAAGLFTGPPDPRLIGGRCGVCATITFPAQPGCPRCGADAMAETPLSPRGRLFTFTTQGFLPKEPYTGPGTDDDYSPYGLGYVELPGEVMVEARLTESDPAKLEIGMEMELVIVPFTHDADGTEVLAYAFTPVGGRAREVAP